MELSRTMKRTWFFALAFGAALLGAPSPRAQQPAVAVDAGEPALKPTNHPRLPSDLSQFWLVPAAARGSGRAAPARAAAINEVVAAAPLEGRATCAKPL